MKLNAVSLNAEAPLAALGVETRSIDPGRSLPSNPFVGLRPFDSEESFLFFGRDKQSLKLLQQLQSKHFLAVVGSSGCGKSSLIRAGMIPKLKAGFLVERRDKWRIAIMKPGEFPLKNLSRTLLELASAPSNPEASAAFASELRVSGAQAATGILAEPLQEAEANVLLVVDQFEELFRYDRPRIQALPVSDDDQPVTEDSDGERLRTESAKRELRRDEAASFVSTILELANQRELPIYVVMTMRSDFLGDCDAFHGLPETINETFYLVPRLNREQRMEAVEKPIKLYGQNITSRLLDLVVNDVGDESDQLPVMQHALMRTWEKWKAREAYDKAIDLPHYEAAGMISGALSRDAEKALGELAPDERLIAKRMFQALVETDVQGRNVRRPAHLIHLAGIAQVSPSKVLGVVEHFRREGRCFLTLTSERVEDDPLIDISHESLIRQWAQLGKWVRSENYSKDLYTRVASAAQRHARVKGGLLTDTDLHIAVDWWGSRKPNEAWSLRYNRQFRLAEKYLNDSKAKSDKEKAELERQRLRELETERVQHQNKRLRLMMYALGVISLVALLGLGGTALSFRKATQNANLATRNLKEAERLATFATGESKRASEQASIAQQQADAAEQARAVAIEKAEFAGSETIRANTEAELAKKRLVQVEAAQRALRLANDRNVQNLNKQRRDLIDQLGANYQKAISLAGTPKTLEQAVLSYEDILRVYETEGARGGRLSTLLVLARLFDGSLISSDFERALEYYEPTLSLFEINDEAERAKKILTLVKMGDLLTGEKRRPEAATRFEEAVSLGYQPVPDEKSSSVYRKLGDLYYSFPGTPSLEKARHYYELELAHLDRRIKDAPDSPAAIGNKIDTLIRLGTVHMRLGNKTIAKENYELALSLSTRPPVELPIINTLTRIGASLNRPEEKQERDEYLKRALETADSPGESRADALKRVGDSLNTQDPQEALTYFKQAEALYESQDAKLAPTYRSIATTYERLGDKEKALDYYRRSLLIYEKLRSSPSVVASIKYRIQLLSKKE